MAGEKGDSLAMDVSYDVVIAGAAKWCVDGDFFDVGQAGQVIHAAASNHAYSDGFGHGTLL